jgi:hypothetical protein
MTSTSLKCPKWPNPRLPSNQRPPKYQRPRDTTHRVNPSHRSDRLATWLTEPQSPDAGRPAFHRHCATSIRLVPEPRWCGNPWGTMYGKCVLSADPIHWRCLAMRASHGEHGRQPVGCASCANVIAASAFDVGRRRASAQAIDLRLVHGEERAMQLGPEIEHRFANIGAVALNDFGLVRDDVRFEARS